MGMSLDRRSLLAGLSGLPLLATGAARAGGPAVLTDIELPDETLLEYFVKLRYSLDARITIGWVDAVTYGFSAGETFPLYRLLAATWERVVKDESGARRRITLEIAFFLDQRTGALLEKLTIPLTGRTVAVPLYRAGPSMVELVAHYDRTREFSMQRETREGQAFFVTGRSISQAFLSQPQRQADDFYLRHDISTRVYGAEGEPPSFFYREWTVTRGSWAALNDPGTVMVASDLAYSATTAWRPWMQMGDLPGHTVQNGVGSRSDRFTALPAALQELTRRHHPDLAGNPAAVLVEPDE